MLKEILKKITKSRTGQQFTRTVGIFECDECCKLYESKFSPRLTEKLSFCSKICMDQSARTGKLLEAKRSSALKKYGTTHHEKSDSYKQKKKEDNLEKWGVDHHWRLDDIKKKRESTWKNNYGVSNPFKAEVIKEKVRQVCLDRYGTENPFSSEEIKSKIKQTCLERYGVDHISKLQEVHQKQVEAQVGMSYEFYYEVFLKKFDSYRRKVWAETKKQPLQELENFDKRARTNGYHLDHIYSVKQGFINDVDPKIIGNICNLRMLKCEENISKRDRCDMTLEDLLESYKKKGTT